MNITDFIQLGIGGVAIVSSVVIVKEVLKSNREKDKEFVSFIKTQEENFNKTINNHMNHETKANLELKNANQRLARAVEELIEYLKNNKNL